MKHKPKITIILLTMFLVTQFIGLYVVNHYIAEENDLPYGMDQPEIESNAEYLTLFPFIIMAFIIAITIMFLMSKFNWEIVLRLWFFIVVAIALGLSFNVILTKLQYASLIAFIIALPLAYIKIFKQNFIVHNATELFIYPGIAAVFVPLLNLYTIIGFLILISLYDAWAVWHSGFMQKMAKYQIKKLNIFSGFFVPYASKGMKNKIKKMKATLSKEELSKKRIKVNVAILGGGDVIFPIITAGVMLKLFTFYHSLFVIAGATLGLGFLLFRSEKKKFYPAMPFITAGIFVGMIASYFIL
jgi:presenilin-like A22 family membrane protease